MAIAAARPTMPYVFVLSATSASQLNALRALEVKEAWQYLRRGVSIWTLQTFLELKKRGWPVALMGEPQPGSVNFVHVLQLFRRRPSPNLFFVSIQADCPAIPWTSANIVQNRLQADARRSFWIPHWPQPGLIPRSPGRDDVACVAYAGDPAWMAGSEVVWRAALRSCGIEFRCLDADNWNDYSGVDILLAIRSFDKSPYAYKPPSKLLNAWHARIPLVGGYDSAFEQIGRPGYDYLRVCTLDEAIETICVLRKNPNRYRSIVEAGALSALKYTRERVADAWENLLSGPIASRHKHWKENRHLCVVGERMRFHTWRISRFLRTVAKSF